MYEPDVLSSTPQGFAAAQNVTSDDRRYDNNQDTAAEDWDDAENNRALDVDDEEVFWETGARAVEHCAW